MEVRIPRGLVSRGRSGDRWVDGCRFSHNVENLYTYGIYEVTGAGGPSTGVSYGRLVVYEQAVTN